MGYEKAVLIPEGQSKEIKVQFNQPNTTFPEALPMQKKRFWEWTIHLRSILRGKRKA